MTRATRPTGRDLMVAMLTTVIAVVASTALEAQSRRVDPAGTYAIEVAGAPGVLSLRYNATARRPIQPNAPAGPMEQAGVFLGANSCVPHAHALSSGQGLWQIEPGTRRRGVVGGTLHTFSSVPGGTAFRFEKIIWTFTIEIAGHGIRGDIKVQYFDSLENLAAGLPACVSESLDVRGWATFPSS